MIWTAEQLAFVFRQEREICLSDKLWGPLNLVSSECRGSSPGVKRPGLDSDNSPQSSAETMNGLVTSPLQRISSWRGAWLITGKSLSLLYYAALS
jgi:hypothetical protein